MDTRESDELLRGTLMAVSQDVAGSSSPASTVAPTASSERLHSLDILRGFAILGMFVVHFVQFNPNHTAGGAIGFTIQEAIRGLVTNKSRWTFSLLFGVGFAIQLRRADARGEDGRWPFLRRLLGVAGFGVLTGILIGATTLIGYAWAGLWLLLIRRWSIRALLVALLVGATLIGVWDAAMGTYQWATMGVERANATYQSSRPWSPAARAAHQNLRVAQEGTSFLRVAEARFVDRVYWGPRADLWGDWQHDDPGVLLDSLSSALSIFLIGLLAVRLGVFDRPGDHRRLLYSVMLVGTASWAVAHTGLLRLTRVIPSVRVAESIQSGFGLFSDGYLALAYVAAITLLVASSKAWERRLTAGLGAAGRMALTNYVLHFALLSVFFDKYGLGVTWLRPQFAPVAAIVLFAVLAAFSRWWLARFRFGPAEWALRSLTYARLQPLRRPAAREV